MRRSLRILVCLALVAAAVAGSSWYGVSTFFAYLETPGPSDEPTTVVLPRGVGLGEIVHRLGEAGVIQKPWLFQLAVRIGGHDRQLKAGEYIFPAGATPARVLEMLAGGETAIRRLTIAEGLTVAEV